MGSFSLPPSNEIYPISGPRSFLISGRAPGHQPDGREPLRLLELFDTSARWLSWNTRATA